jgi:hypothetical protein
VYALDEAIREFAGDQIGTIFDHKAGRALVIFHTDFRDYASAQRRVAPEVTSIDVLLVPGCHSRAEIAKAERVLSQRDWHPAAKRTPLAFHLDPSFSGFDVVVDESAPEVAESLAKMLGQMVRVSLGRPQRT